MRVSPATFWNKKSTVTEFASYPPPTYWVEFLRSFKSPLNIAVLDIGCGAGRNSALAARMKFNIHACDLHKEMVKKTRKILTAYFSAVELKKRVGRASVQRLPYPSYSFDVVIASGVLHNTDRYDKFARGVKEIARILKKNGFLCLNVFFYRKKDVDQTLQRSKKYCRLFRTKIGLPMILLPKKDIIQTLGRFGFVPSKTPVTYRSQVSTGKRSVLRGVFVKSV